MVLHCPEFRPRRAECALDQPLSLAKADGPVAHVSIGEACLAQGVTATALVLLDPQTNDAQLAEALSSLRPFVSMLVVAHDADCVRSVLDAFGA